MMDLYIRWRAENPVKKLVVHSKLKMMVLQLAHDLPIARHPGVDMSLAQLKQRFICLRTGAGIGCYCQNCLECQQTEAKSPPRALLILLPLVDSLIRKGYSRAPS